MQHPMLRLTISLFALTITAARVARADKIDFSWQSSFATSSIAPDQPAQGASISLVSMSGLGSSTGVPGHDQYALGMAYQSPYFVSALAMYDYKPFIMTVKLTDGPSGLSDNLTFHGTVAGGILFIPPAGMRGEVASFAFSDGVRSITIGQDVYHIAMPPGTIGGGWDPIPNILAQIDVAHVSNNPEPSSLVLAAMVLPVLGFARRKKPAAPTNKS